MRKLLVFFILAIANTTIAQEEEWDVYLASYNGKPGSTVINMGLKKTAPLVSFPYVLVTGVRYTNCREDGFPEEGELDRLHVISDSLDATLERVFTIKKAGTFTNNCERLEYYYLSDTMGVRSKLQHLYVSVFGSYVPYINIKADRKWTYYLEFLYPNETIREYMSNQKVLDALLKSGDKLEAARKVDHWAYFKTTKDLDCFQAAIKAMGFAIEGTGKDKKSPMPFRLQFSRNDKVDLSSISAITNDLRKKAVNCQGDYDGWETFVIKDQ